MIVEKNSTHRSAMLHKVNPQKRVEIKQILKENLKNRSIHHKSIIDAYFKNKNVTEKNSKVMQAYN